MRDRVTQHVALISVNQLENAYYTWGVDYPICGDTLKSVRADSLVKIKVKPLTEQDKRLIRVMNARISNPELHWKVERKI